MVGSSSNAALEAFRRLLADGQQGGQSKVDALVALSQRTLFVATWKEGGDELRALVNSDGASALPVFTDEAMLQDAARRFGWSGADDHCPLREFGARGVFGYAVTHDISYVVVDIAQPHSLEVEQAELAPLMATSSRSDSSGPFAAVGRISSTMLAAVKAQPTTEGSRSHPPAPLEWDLHAAPPVPPPPIVTDPAPPPTFSSAPPAAAPASIPPAGVKVVSTSASPPPASSAAPAPANATFGSGSSVNLWKVTEEPADELLEALTDFLRSYPEVEWAAYCMASRGPTEPLPTIGLRVDTAYRMRVNEIIRGLRAAGDAVGASLDIMLLDDAQVMRQARADGVAFFPWKR